MYQYKAKIDRVVDGDTIDLIIDLGFKITTHQRIRLAEINTPETYNVKRDSEEYKKGMVSKNYVEKRLAENNNEVIIETDKLTGKYGRYIGTIRLSDSEVSLNRELVDEGLAEWATY